MLVSGSSDTTIKLWTHNHPIEDCRSKQEKEFSAIHTLKTTQNNNNNSNNPNGSTVKCLHLENTSINNSPRLASGEENSTVRIWDIATVQLIRTLNGHRKGVWSIQWMLNDSHILFTGSDDATIKQWVSMR